MRVSRRRGRKRRFRGAYPFWTSSSPPSELKREKNRIYAEAGRLLAEAQAAYALGGATLPAAFPQNRASRARSSAIPPRSALAFPHELLPCGMPFATPRILRAGAALPERDGASWLPLAPLVADPASYARLVEDRTAETLERGVELGIGIGTLHHIALARDLDRRFPAAGERLFFFVDIHLYIANRLALAAIAHALPRLAFAYYYIEGDAGGLAGLRAGLAAATGAPALAPVDPDFEAPLFLSSGCLLKHHAADGACPEPCARSWSARLRDRDRRYIALVEDCVSMLFLVPRSETRRRRLET